MINYLQCLNLPAPVHHWRNSLSCLPLRHSIEDTTNHVVLLLVELFLLYWEPVPFRRHFKQHVPFRPCWSWRSSSRCLSARSRAFWSDQLPNLLPVRMVSGNVLAQMFAVFILQVRHSAILHHPTDQLKRGLPDCIEKRGLSVRINMIRINPVLH